MLICVIAAYNEEAMIRRAVTSAFWAGCDAVHVFDGAWDGFAKRIPSTDATELEALRVGAIFHYVSSTTQAGKRTAMFHNCAAQPGDHVFSLDADETVEGVFPELGPHHYNVMFQNLVANDMPGIRLDFPLGDGGLTPFPLLRVFAYNQYLSCTTGGIWFDTGKWIEPYSNGTQSRLPLVPGVRLFHHAHERSPDRIAEKMAFYEVDHKRRRPPL